VCKSASIYQRTQALCWSTLELTHSVFVFVVVVVVAWLVCHPSRPKKGSALLFFPAAGGIPNTPFDIRTLHCGEAVDEASSTDKWISQLWLRESTYTPTAPPGNLHASAKEAITDYCGKNIKGQ
jgi:hypothetical protein